MLWLFSTLYLDGTKDSNEINNQFLVRLSNHMSSGESLSKYRCRIQKMKKYLSVLLDRIHYKTLLTIFLLRQRKFFVVL